MCPDLVIAEEVLYTTCGITLTNLKLEAESQEYNACSFHLNDVNVIFRTSKITPTKVGQFVTIWKRNSEGITQPFDVSDDFDIIIISCRDANNFGQFIFPKSILTKHLIITDVKEGKRGIRVYPPWVHTLNKQAQKTQNWQIAYFIPINNNFLSLGIANQLLSK